MKIVNTKKRITAVLMSFALVFLPMLQIFMGVETAYAAPASYDMSDINVSGAGFNNPSSIAIANDGTLYVANPGSSSISGSGKVMKLPSGSSTWEEISEQPPPNGREEPHAVAVDSDGTVYVAYKGDLNIRKLLDGSSTWVTINAGASHKSIAVDGDGTLYTIHNYPGDTDAQIFTIPDADDISYGQIFSSPKDIAVSSDGTVYVTNTNHDKIVKLPSGASEWVEIPEIFNKPQSVAIGSDGTLYVADAITANPIKRLLPGSSTWETIAVSDELHDVKDMIVGSDGTLYVINVDDQDAATIKKLMPQYTVTFLSEGSTVGNQTVTKNVYATRPSDPSRIGHTFAGWFPESSSSAFDFSTNITEDLTLEAGWTPISYPVSFDVDGGSVTASVYAPYNTTITAPTAPTKANYSFGGWYKESALTNTWDFATDKVLGATPLYAKWTPIEYAVNFDVDGGSAVTNVNAPYNTTITAPTAPTKANHSFGGWYKEPALTNAWDFATDKVLGATTLYAKWTRNDSSNNGGGNTPTVQPEIPTEILEPTPKPFYIEHVNIDVIKALVEKAKSAPVLTFNDIPEGSSTAKTIELATKLGIVKGYADGSFHADAKVTRAEFATMLVNALGLTPEGDSSFKDTEGHWAADAIATLEAKGIINGYLDGTFKPNQSISRAEIVAMLSKVMNLTLVKEVKFKDISGYWAEDEINTLSDMGIVKGTSDDLFEPNAKATRHESLLMILRMLNASLGYTLDVE